MHEFGTPKNYRGPKAKTDSAVYFYRLDLSAITTVIGLAAYWKYTAF